MSQWAFGRGPLHQTRGWILFETGIRSGKFGFGWGERFDGIRWLTGWFEHAMVCGSCSFSRVTDVLGFYVSSTRWCVCLKLCLRHLCVHNGTVRGHPARFLYVAESCSFSATTQRLAAAVVQQLVWELFATHVVTPHRDFNITVGPHTLGTNYPHPWPRMDVGIRYSLFP